MSSGERSQVAVVLRFVVSVVTMALKESERRDDKKQKRDGSLDDLGKDLLAAAGIVKF